MKPFHMIAFLLVVFFMAFLVVGVTGCSSGGGDDGATNPTETGEGESGETSPNNPPIFQSIGEERFLNSVVNVTEGNDLNLSLSASDPDGDPITFSAKNLPEWASLDTSTGRVSGTAPLWSDDPEIREDQEGIFDVVFSASDGKSTSKKIVTIHVIDASWPEKTTAELVADRPILSGGAIASPVDISIISDETVPSEIGNGKQIRKITFGFTSQVPDVAGWENDWVSSVNIAFLPVNGVAAANVGVIVEGSYSGVFGETQLAERVCVELDIPALIIDRGWEMNHAGNLMEKYDAKAVETRNPAYMFYTFFSAHYLRSADALITILDTMTNEDVSFSDFRVMFTGHSKLGHSCYSAAAADPQRVAGFMSSGSGNWDTGAERLLGKYQHALTQKPDANPNYRGCMMKYYYEALNLQYSMNSDVRALVTMGTDDDKGSPQNYTPKYILATTEDGIAVPYRFGCIPNAPHTTTTQYHADFWKMWVRHTFLGDPVTVISSAELKAAENGDFQVTCSVSGPEISEAKIWVSSQNDMDTSNWNGFSAYTMTVTNGVYTGTIPSDTKSWFIEVEDTSGGIVTTAPQPVDTSYFSRLPDSI